ncbi:MAG TPA: amidohydrolase family protein [Sphingomicrobium sp.]|nr:amidohydrolase family protein [Sphingomicrobium sp.]
MRTTALTIALALALQGCAATPLPKPTNPAVETHVVPLVDHHQHLVSPAAASGDYPPPLAEVKLPSELADLISRREKAGRDAKALADLYTEDAVALNMLNEDLPTWVRGRAAVAEHIATLFAKPYRIEPVSVTANATHATVAGYYLRPELGRRTGHVLLSLAKGGDRRWRIAAETPALPGPFVRDPFDADKLIAQLDEAGIARAVVLSVAYWFGSDFRSVKPTDEYAATRAENDWVAAQIARYPDRLVAFCSFNPLRSYALTELERCAASGHFKGIKLHFGNSDVDLRKAEHAGAIGRVFAAANRNNMAIVVHLWTSPEYDEHGDVHARHFLEAVAQGPDVTVQVAHLAGGGRASLKAMEVFAQAFEARDPRTRHLYFDVASSADKESAGNLARDAALMRRIGLDRILYGSDLSPPNPAPLSAWAGFHKMPLTDAEFRTIANNVAPYMRP